MVSAFVHPVYGDLAQPDSVTLPPEGPLAYPEAGDTLFIHLTTTMRCQGRCAGCINSAITFPSAAELLKRGSQETVPERDAKAIAALIRQDGATDVVVCFYGGEPLLATDKMAAVMRELNALLPERTLRYMVYTNGMGMARAHEVNPGFDRDIWLYSVSIDGTAPQHDAVRCGLPLDEICRNLEAVRARADARVIMWSTIREEQSVLDCFEQFLRLRDAGLADHFFWHFVETDSAFTDVRAVAETYEKELRTIMAEYVRRLERGDPLSVLHIDELLLYILSGKQRGSTACGVELARNYDIVGGVIQSCADLPDRYALGRIADDGSVTVEERKLAGLVGYKSELGCHACGIHAYCGGRCPVQALTGSQERLREYCILMRLHVAIVAEFAAPIAELWQRRGISAQQIHDTSAYYVQFTDVTP